MNFNLQEVFSRRLKQFYASTSPLLAHYSSQPQSSQALATISGNTSDEIWPKLEAEVLRVCPTLTVRSGSREDMTEETRKATLANVVVATESQPQMTAKL
jgi:nucleoside-triphosphate--adenylate kinase